MQNKSSINPSVATSKNNPRSTSQAVPRSVEADSRETPFEQLARFKFLYAVLDTITNEIIGGIQLHLNNQSAVRTMEHILKQPNSVVTMNPGDFELWKLGTIDHLNNLLPARDLILSGLQIVTLADKLNGDYKGA